MTQENLWNTQYEVSCHVHVGVSCGICSTHVRSTYKNIYTYKNADETCKMARHDEQVISF